MKMLAEAKVNLYKFTVLSISTIAGFIGSYFYDILLSGAPQYILVTLVVFIDGVFGIIAGTKREGFKTFKFLKIIKSWFAWALILTGFLAIEQTVQGTGWISETFIVPFAIAQLISSMKNASMAGFIHVNIVNQILDKIDSHKGIRDGNRKI